MVNGQTNPSRRIGKVAETMDRFGPGAFSLIGRTQEVTCGDSGGISTS